MCRRFLQWVVQIENQWLWQGHDVPGEHPPLATAGVVRKNQGVATGPSFSR